MAQEEAEGAGEEVVVVEAEGLLAVAEEEVARLAHFHRFRRSRLQAPYRPARR